MFVHYRAKGFVFSKENRSEADQLFKIYTQEFGRLEILARAIRKTSSKLRSGIDIFTLSDIEFIQGKAQKTLTDAVLLEKFVKTRKNLEKSEIMHRMANFLDSLIKEQEKDQRIYSLILEVFREMEKDALIDGQILLLYYYFFWNLVSFAGYQPELHRCFSCQKKLSPGKINLSREGGLICPECSAGKSSDYSVSPETIKIVRVLLEGNLVRAKKLKLEEKQIKELEVFSEKYRKIILEKNS